MDESHQESGLEMIRLLFENLVKACPCALIFFRLEIHFGEKLSQFVVCWIVLVGQFEKVLALRCTIGDEQIVRFFNPQAELFAVRPAVGVHDPLHAAAETIHFLRFEDSLIDPFPPFRFEIFEIDAGRFQRIRQGFDHRVINEVAGRNALDGIQ